MHIQRHSQLLRHRRERTTPAPPAHPLAPIRRSERKRRRGWRCAGALVDGWMGMGRGEKERERERDPRKQGGVEETAMVPKKRKGGVLPRSPSYFRVAFCPRYIGG